MNTISIEAIADCIRTKRPDLTVTINEITKNRQTLTGLTIKSPAVNIAPNIYVDSYLEQFDDVEAIATAILNTYEQHKCLKDFDVNTLLDKDFILSHVQPVMQQQSDEQLIKLPNISERYPGAEAYLAIVSQSSDNESYSIKLNPQILANAGIDIEKDNLFERAIQNLNPQIQISSLYETIRNMSGINFDTDDVPILPSDMNMYIITNHTKTKGAAAILCDEVLKAFAKEHNLADKGFYILPSSVHECLLVFGDELNEESLSEMVQNVNETQLEPIDILANQAWLYKPQNAS